MTRRIAIAILVTTWISLIVIGTTIYAATRHVLLANLDASILSKAMTLQEAVEGTASGLAPGASLPEGDRYIVRSATGRTLARPTTTPAPLVESPLVLNRAFVVLADGQRLRTLTFSAVPIRASGQAARITITYSASCAQFDALLRKLMLWLLGASTVCGLVSAAAAVVMSRIALGPLRQTADVIGEIDERQLDRRIDTTSLPTELVPMAERLNQMLSRLQSAFERRRRFLADASHELRTPVTAILTTAEVALRRPRAAEALAGSLRACLSDARALRHLVDWLMQQVRSESSAIVEPAERFDAIQLIRECIDSVTRASCDNSVQIRADLPPELQLITQAGRLRSVITNLLQNAVEYGRPGGSVAVSCAIGEKFVLTVADDGPGIAPELLKCLFEPFARGARNGRDGNGHLGLGLSIVRAHVTAMGGVCETRSIAGTGTTFCVVLARSVVCEVSETGEPMTIISAS